MTEVDFFQTEVRQASLAAPSLCVAKCFLVTFLVKASLLRALHLILVSNWHSFITFEPLWSLQRFLFKNRFLVFLKIVSLFVLQGRVHSRNIVLLRAHRVTQAVTTPVTLGSKVHRPLGKWDAGHHAINKGSRDFWVCQKHWRCHCRSEIHQL